MTPMPTTYGEAIKDPRTKLYRMAKESTEQRERVIGEWMALGYSREEAYKAALFGFRK